MSVDFHTSQAITVAAVGDVGSPSTWSGIPWSFWQAAVRLGWDATPAQLDLAPFRWKRRWWNLRKLVRRGSWGGYQYSREFLDEAEEAVAPVFRRRTVISFNHQFPRATTIRKMGGRIVYYLDAVLGAELAGLGLPLRLRHGAEEALEIEQENLRNAECVCVMASWLQKYLIDEYRLDPAKIHVVAPGANLTIPPAWQFVDREQDRPFVLGLVGTDWRRKGLEFLLAVAGRMRARGVDVKIRVLGPISSQLPRSPLIEAPGFVHKAREAARFCDLLGSCDLGCLFSSHEAYGISVLEFLRLGVPVAGFNHEGMADSLPPDAAFRFETGSSAEAVAQAFAEFARDRAARRALRERARVWSPRVTWDRCLEQMGPILAGVLSR